MVDFKNLDKLESGDLIFICELRAVPVDQRMGILMDLHEMVQDGKAKSEYYLVSQQRILSGPYDEPDQIPATACTSDTDIVSCIRIL